MDFDIQNKKIELIQWLSTLNDESIIKKIELLRDREKADWWEAISAQERESIDKGIKDADSGNLNSQLEVKSLYEKWL